MSLTSNELRAAVEAILLVAGEPVKVESLVDTFPEEGREAIEAELAQIVKRHSDGSGFFLEQAAGGYRFVTRAELDPHLRKFFAKQGEGRLSMAALETLAIVAYRQPVTAPEVNDIRGVNSSGVLRTLLERKMIRIAGRKNVVGSPFLYRTTQEFLLHFGLNSIQDLPRLEEFAEVLGENVTEEMLGAIAGHDSATIAGFEETSDGSPIGSDAESASAEDEQVQQESEGEMTTESEEEPVEADPATTSE